MGQLLSQRSQTGGPRATTGPEGKRLRYEGPHECEREVPRVPPVRPERSLPSETAVLSALRNRSAGRRGAAGACGGGRLTAPLLENGGEGPQEREVTCMKADGNCYFYAVTATGAVQDDVGAEASGPSGLRHAAELRRQAAEYIRANPDVFEAVSLAAAADDPGGYARYTEEAPGGGVRLADSRGAAGRLASWLERDSVEEAPATARRARTAVYFSFEAQRRPDAPPDAQQDAPVGEVYGVSLVTVWQDGVRKLRRGSVAATLPGVLLSFMQGDRKCFLFLTDSLSRSFGKPAMEDGLDEAWRTACALNLPLSEDMERCVVSNLVMFRYVLSQEDPTSDVPAAADAHKRWHELWARVDLLLEYSRRLQDELERVQCDDGAPGCADLSVMLVRLCALALRNAKRSFAATYKDVPWEEMEYLLVMFIEGRTVRRTLAHRVATVQCTAAHLRCFRERVEKYVMVHRAEPDPEVAMKRLKKEPRKERAAILVGVVDGALSDLRKDFALLMDWHSLTEITETLGTASEALGRLEDADWAAWGWLALRWALFVVGERVKHSWTSPNLSPRWAVLIEALAPGGVLKIMSTIRDDQEHGKDGSNAKTLALSGMKKSEREKLREELLKLADAARAALKAAGSEVECSDDNDWDGKYRVEATKKDSKGMKDLMGEELLKILEPAKHKAEGAFEAIRALSQFRIEPRLRAEYMTRMLPSFGLEHIPGAGQRVLRLLLHKSAENIENFQAVLREVTPPSVSSPLETLRRALTAMEAVPEGQLRNFAFCGALRELASRWHEDDQVVATAVPFSPALFGRQLRNYLNHLDEVSFFCSPLEINALHNLLRQKNIPLEQGARPRLRDPWWSRAENERLRRLVELKSDMFRYAREGELGELQRLVENGADVSVRDCQGKTLLHAAAQGGQVYVVEWLLGLGAEVVDPLATDWCGFTALHDAGTAAVAKAMLAAGPVHQNGTFKPLHHAAWCDRAEEVAVLLGAPCDLDAENNKRLRRLEELKSDMFRYAREGELGELQRLVENGANVNVRDCQGNTLLHAAVEGGQVLVLEWLLGLCGRAEEVAVLLRDPRDLDAENNKRLRRLEELKSDMFRYAREGELGELQRLVENGADVSVRDCQGNTLLHAAAQGGQVHVVEWLLGLGAEVVDPLATDWCGFTALHDAGTAAVAEAMLAAGPVHQNGTFTPLHHAAWCGRAEVVAVLLKNSRDLDAEDNERRTPLHWAARHGHDQVVRLLLDAGAHCQAAAHGQTPLVFAAISGSAPTVRLLLGATPPPADEDCWTAAMVTARLASEEACFALLDELKARGLLQWGPAAREVLLQTAYGGSSAIALRLLDLSPDALSECLKSDTGATVLHAAAFAGRADLVRTLLRCGADPLCEDAGGETALVDAAGGAPGVGGVPDIITALVERIPGGNLQVPLARALCWAAMFGQLGTVQRLVHHGADVDADGGTPLGLAAKSGHTEVVRWLLQRGADPRLGAPLHMAAKHGRLGVVKLLVPPLHGGEEGQDEPGKEEPSALRVAVQDGSREDVERILRRFVEHLRPLSSRYTKEDRLRDKAEATAALRRKEEKKKECLRLLQQLDGRGRTALHWAASVSALPVVEYLLDREGELLRPIYSKCKNTGVPRLDGLSVYSRDAADCTALQVGALGLCAPSVAEALLKRMGDTMWMALGHKDLQEVRGMAMRALNIAILQPDSGRLVRALCGWLSRSGEGLLSGEGEEGLQDMRRRVLSRVRWRRAVRRMLRRAAPPVDPLLQRLRGRVFVVEAMRAYLQEGARGETAVQLLSQWLCDLSEDAVAESKVLEISEAVDVLRQFK